MRLQIVIHLQPVLQVPQKAIRVGELPGFGVGQQMVLHQFFQRGKRLGILQERDASAVDQLQRLRDEFDFADAATAQFDVAIDFARLHHFVFDALFGPGHLAQNPFAQ